MKSSAVKMHFTLIWILLIQSDYNFAWVTTVDVCKVVTSQDYEIVIQSKQILQDLDNKAIKVFV